MQGRMKRWPMLVGVVAGLFTWVYDYDFFLNPGGPATPISIAILRGSHLEHSSVLVFMFWPLFILMSLGAGIGFVMSRLRG